MGSASNTNRIQSPIIYCHSTFATLLLYHDNRGTVGRRCRLDDALVKKFLDLVLEVLTKMDRDRLELRSYTLCRTDLNVVFDGTSKAWNF